VTRKRDNIESNEGDRTMAEERRVGDLVLAQGEYALVQDGASGDVMCIVGPNKTSLADTDNPVVYSGKTGRFTQCIPREAITPWPAAREGQYVVLTNPATEDAAQHPNKGKQSAIPLAMGSRVNIPGPATFALYPGQSAEVIGGHTLRSNQYLMVRVVNGEVAMENWESTILKKQTSSSSGKDESGDGSDDETIATKEDVPTLVTGQLLIVKGTDVSFYIPPTGIEVLPDNKNDYVRDAVTLEQLEYCILRDEDGTKEFLRGPAVVFPKPTQTFFTTDGGHRKFRAIELEEHWGIFVKVIKAYEEGGKEFSEGEELFITGEKQKIYFPRPEHSIIRYGKEEIHYAVAIPKGESRYVLNRQSGDVSLVQGPKMYLPDPRKEVVVRRVIDSRMIQLLYPDNTEALRHNEMLSTRSVTVKGMPPSRARRAFLDEESGMEDALMEDFGAYEPEEVAEKFIAADEFARRTQYTPPRTIELNTKYDGAVAIRIWTGYAMKISSKTGESKVAVGPCTVLLEYDEVPETFILSTGTPKSLKSIKEDVYLRVKANKVSDIITAETRDFVHVKIPLSYRVNFEGDKEKWFDVRNYVMFLTDHLRSFVANVVKRYGIEEFNGDYINILRDNILGTSTEGENGGKQRPGRQFEENDMRIYDVELGQLIIGDASIAEMLQKSQHESVSQTLQIAMARRHLETTQENEKIEREIAEAKAETGKKAADLEIARIQKQSEVELAAVVSDIQRSAKCLEGKLQGLEMEAKILEEKRDQKKADHNLDLEIREKQLKLELDKIKGEAEGIAEKTKSITPQLVAAMQQFGDKAMVMKLADSMSPLAILGGKNLIEVTQNLLKGTQFENVLSVEKIAPTLATIAGGKSKK